MRVSAVVLLCFLLSGFSSAQTGLAPAAARQWRQAHQADILKEFTDLLSIPDVASDSINIQRNAETLIAMLKKRGVETQLLTASGVNPVVFGEIKTPGAKHTLVFYAHYDGQPVTPSEWEGGAPFTPVTRKVNGEDRIYA